MPLSVNPSSLSSPCQEICHHGSESNSKETVESQTSSPAHHYQFRPIIFPPACLSSIHRLTDHSQVQTDHVTSLEASVQLQLLPQRDLFLPYQVPQKNVKSAKSRLINILQGSVQKAPLWVVGHSKMVPPSSVLPYPSAHTLWKALDTSED